MNGPVLLLLAHGSRDPRHAATVRALVARIREQRPGVRVEPAFLDHCQPSVPRVMRWLASEGVDGVTAVPLLLSRAYHATWDVPAVLAEAAARHPRLAIHRASVLGRSPLLITALERRLAEAGEPPAGARRGSTGVVLASAGSSDPAALAAIDDLALSWQRATGWFAVHPAYASAAAPATGEAVRALRAAGAERVIVALYVLAPGLLPDRVIAQAGASGAAVTTRVLGDAPEVARLVLRRYDQANADPERTCVRPAPASAALTV